MKIGIIGGGAIGLLFAFHLSKLFPVTLYVKRQSQLSLIQNNGITLINDSVNESREVSVTLWNPATTLEEDVLIIAVKQYSLLNIIPSLKEIAKNKVVLFLQNGMSHLEMMESLHQPHLLVGVVEHGVKKKNDATVEWTGIGRTKIAAMEKYTFSKEIPFITSWADELKAVFPVEWNPDYYKMMIEKLLVNAVINPLTALFNVKNGELLKNPYFRETMKELFEEISFLISPMNRKSMWEHVVNICNSTSENWSSMQRDIIEGRKTEVDAILGYILIKAAKEEKKTPITAFLYHSIKGLEKENTSCIKNI
ncbi:2-dehydropantoate 2-reductase [Sutcliffiella rhizosphaerae]|uniref:2-dehydropantoate 2-reductase n=1 Tax=Sutcliffiella rhizosphaerae TaxID=2880967 RepID=A0ABN8A472_9BACI|nr:2-dehydropantoate 2-reductase [Sutcliffiella rhizosphaerae]CAG9619814.1 2-dehydropantoate 2-reductase [Sutcliffiella rhizosphaerae]